MLRRSILVLVFAAVVLAQETPTVKMYWASPNVANVALPGSFHPKIRAVLHTQSPPQPFKLAWTVTDSVRAKPWAVGGAVLTDAQTTLVEADSQIMIVKEVDWTKTFSQLPASWRNRVNQFCDDIGTTRPLNTEVLRDLFHRLVSIIEPLKSIESIFAEAESKPIP
jgi:hypothetical protein